MSDWSEWRWLDREPLWLCLACHLNPTPDWHILYDKLGFEYHVGFDGEPCGPISGIPSSPNH